MNFIAFGLDLWMQHTTHPENVSACKFNFIPNTSFSRCTAARMCVLFIETFFSFLHGRIFPKMSNGLQQTTAHKVNVALRTVNVKLVGHTGFKQEPNSILIAGHSSINSCVNSRASYDNECRLGHVHIVFIISIFFPYIYILYNKIWDDIFTKIQDTDDWTVLAVLLHDICTSQTCFYILYQHSKRDKQ